uniref:Transmembrane protein 209 n=1 Tax=Aceria tosichella TaxID=561515 RepID=A0A6G1SHE7_9ACAR
MDTSDLIRSKGVTPKKSPTAENVQRRRLDIEKSELAAYWALFNTSVAILLYYDLCYLRILENFSTVLMYIEWVICSLFTASACYDFYIHFWPHTFMRPIVVSPQDKRLLGIQEDEFGFKVAEPAQVKTELTYDSFPPFEIHHSFEEDEKIVTPPKRVYWFLRMSQKGQQSP